MGPTALGGGATGEQEGGAVDDVAHASQALQDLGGGRGHDHRVRGGRPLTCDLTEGDQGIGLLEQVDAQLEDIGAGVDGAAGLDPSAGGGRTGQGDGDRGRFPGTTGDGAPAPGQ